MGLHGLLGDIFTFLYVDYVRTSQETPMGLHGLLPGITFSCHVGHLTRTIIRE
jgi:hypothetical protein